MCHRASGRSHGVRSASASLGVTAPRGGLNNHAAVIPNRKFETPTSTRCAQRTSSGNRLFGTRSGPIPPENRGARLREQRIELAGEAAQVVRRRRASERGLHEREPKERLVGAVCHGVARHRLGEPRAERGLAHRRERENLPWPQPTRAIDRSRNPATVPQPAQGRVDAARRIPINQTTTKTVNQSGLLCSSPLLCSSC